MRVKWEIALGIIVIVAAVIGILALTAQDNAKRVGPKPMQSEHKLKQIGIALLNYRDRMGAFPTASEVVAGQTMSWRVAILDDVGCAKVREAIIRDGRSIASDVESRRGELWCEYFAVGPSDRYTTSVFAIVHNDGIIGNVKASEIPGCIAQAGDGACALAIVCSGVSVDWVLPIECVIDENGECAIRNMESGAEVCKCKPDVVVISDGRVLAVPQGGNTVRGARRLKIGVE